MAASGNILWTLSLLHNANDESCHCVVRIGSPALIPFHCVCFVLFYFVLFFYFFFVDFTTCLGIEVSLQILQIKHWSCSYIPKWSFEGWVASALLGIINVTGLVQFRERLSDILPALAFLELLAAEYLSGTNISNCIYSLLMVTCSLNALKALEEERYDNKKEKAEVLQQTIYSRKETGK